MLYFFLLPQTYKSSLIICFIGVLPAQPDLICILSALARMPLSCGICWARAKSGAPASRAAPGSQDCVITLGNDSLAQESTWHAISSPLRSTGKASSEEGKHRAGSRGKKPSSHASGPAHNYHSVHHGVSSPEAFFSPARRRIYSPPGLSVYSASTAANRQQVMYWQSNKECWHWI